MDWSRFAAWTLPLGLVLVAAGMAGADTAYKGQVLVRLGDRAGDVQIRPDGAFGIGTLNDRGELVFVAENAAGGQVLVHYRDGKLTPLVAGRKEAPRGTWSPNVQVAAPISMNQLGDLVFTAEMQVGHETEGGTFLWNDRAQQVIPVALKGMPAVQGLTFEAGAGFASAINNHSEIALVAHVKTAAGIAQPGVFFLGRDGNLLPVALPDQELPGGGKILSAWLPSTNDAGVVVFLARDQDGHLASLYLWEQGTLMRLAGAGSGAPGGGRFARFILLRVNSHDRSVLVAARIHDYKQGPIALYRFVEGSLSPLVIPGQEMPGGGKLRTLQPSGISFASATGQVAFLAELEDRSTAAYLVDSAGKLSLILKAGPNSSALRGNITLIGHQGWRGSFGIGLNDKGQVALPIQIDGGVDTIVLLSPVP